MAHPTPECAQYHVLGTQVSWHPSLKKAGSAVAWQCCRMQGMRGDSCRRCLELLCGSALQNQALSALVWTQCHLAYL